jgi:hypothetical protein
MISKNAYHVLEYLYPGAHERGEYTLRDDGQGIYIDSWNRLEPKPTDTEIRAVEPVAMAAKRESDLIEYTEERALRHGALIKDPETDQPIADPADDLIHIRIKTNRAKVRTTNARRRGNSEQKTKGQAAVDAEERLFLAVYDLTVDIKAGTITTESEIDAAIAAVPLN